MEDDEEEEVLQEELLDVVTAQQFELQMAGGACARVSENYWEIANFVFTDDKPNIFQDFAKKIIYSEMPSRIILRTAVRNRWTLFIRQFYFTFISL